MLKWEDRPFEIAYSLNPAFLSVLLYEAIYSFNNSKNHNEEMPFALIFLIIPLVFYTPIRDKLPKSENKFLHDWIQENPDIAIHLPKVISQLLPYTKETIIFAMQHEMIIINQNGNFEASNFKSKIDNLKWLEDSRTYKMKDKAKILGKWLANLGSVETIYRTLGITP